MNSLKDLFLQGVSFRSFILNQTPMNRGKFMKYYIPLDIKQEHRERVNRINSKIHILGVVEGGCPDCQINLPILEKLISVNPSIDLRLITRADAKGSLMAYHEEGMLKIPVFLFLDEEFHEKGVFTDMPEKLKGLDVIATENEGILADYRAGKLADETVEQLLKLLEMTA